MEAIMRCVLIRSEGCMFEECRYFINHACILTTIHESGWPKSYDRYKTRDDKRVVATLQAKNDKTGDQMPSIKLNYPENCQYDRRFYGVYDVHLGSAHSAFHIFDVLFYLNPYFLRCLSPHIKTQYFLPINYYLKVG